MNIRHAEPDHARVTAVIDDQGSSATPRSLPKKG
jgi:hypothetical protein